ncbi:purine-cytosine permease family protein [Altererythrobacter ishigakiensis]|uniref:NCS1 family nucleobase:cation symporter-1 n=1 Tax=Altererythrobacter ishigakiensis TaxID=476157 RepID=A0A562UM36_9SPHN|nr:nucleoside transporter [Altererythrobacter ishigakiensis]TWJ06674.1 NCS1 family nucleobase:cation symporter-1 [Altererythrobacter ishigakiensis]
MEEFEREPVAPSALKPGRYFAASYAGEHVAGTEFVIGAMFVSWGVGAGDVISGLLLGNLLAVLSWVLICAPIATETRLTLYAYLEKIAGPGFIKIYSVINGILFCILAGAMITVSASAVRILFGIPPQVEWYPTSATFIFIALGVGAVVSFAAMRGFSFVARFSEVAAPWMIAMFFVGGAALLPVILAGTPSVNSVGSYGDFLSLAETSIWIDQGTEMGFWHVVAIAWGANLAFHGGLGDMSILRFARNSSYAWYSTLGMFIGHFAAWLAAGIMGAGAAMILQQPLTSLDAGEVAFQALGPIGILAVIVAGWTTSNPTIYRSGLAFQSLHPSWSRERVTLIVGVITTMIACFPFVFTKLLDFLGIMALVMAPIGGLIFAEHFLFKKLGLTRYWRSATEAAINVPALLTWIISVGVAALLGYQLGVHVLFLFVPAWLTAMVAYPALSSAMGAKAVDAQQLASSEQAESERRAVEQAWLAEHAKTKLAAPGSNRLLLSGASLSLLVAIVLGVMALTTGDLEQFQSLIVWPTLTYFIFAILLVSREPASQK